MLPLMPEKQNWSKQKVGALNTGYGAMTG